MEASQALSDSEPWSSWANKKAPMVNSPRGFFVDSHRYAAPDAQHDRLQPVGFGLRNRRRLDAKDLVACSHARAAVYDSPVRVGRAIEPGLISARSCFAQDGCWAAAK